MDDAENLGDGSEPNPPIETAGTGFVDADGEAPAADGTLVTEDVEDDPYVPEDSLPLTPTVLEESQPVETVLDESQHLEELEPEITEVPVAEDPNSVAASADDASATACPSDVKAMEVECEVEAKKTDAVASETRELIGQSKADLVAKIRQLRWESWKSWNQQYIIRYWDNI